MRPRRTGHPGVTKVGTPHGKPSRRQKLRALERERRALIERQNARIEELILGAPSRASAVLTFAAAIPTLIASALVFAAPSSARHTPWGVALLAAIYAAFVAMLWHSYHAAAKVLATLPPRPLELSLPPDDFASVGAALIGDDLEREVDAQMVEQAKSNLIANSETLDKLRMEYEASVRHIRMSLILALAILVLGVIMKGANSNEPPPSPSNAQGPSGPSFGRPADGAPPQRAPGTEPEDSERPDSARLDRPAVDGG